MTNLKPTDARITIMETSHGLQIVMPGRRSWFVICFLGFWICGWAVGEVMVPVQYFERHAPPEEASFMLAWFGIWTIGGAFAVYAWFWQVMGKEIVTVRGHTFNIRRDIGGFGFDREYDLLQMRDLHVGQVGFNPIDFSSSLQLWGIGGGVIAFDHGVKTYRFGSGLDGMEAKQVVHAVKQRFRILESAPVLGPR